MTTTVNNALLVLGMLVLWFFFASVVPSFMRVRFRARVMRVNRALIADYDSGLFDEHPEEVQRLFREIQIARRCAQELTPAKLLVFRLILVRCRRPARSEVSVDSFSDKSARERLETHVDAFHDALLKHFFFGSPSGWFIIGLGSLLLLTVLAIAVPINFLSRIFRLATPSARNVWAAVQSLEARLTDEQVGALPDLATRTTSMPAGTLAALWR